MLEPKVEKIIRYPENLHKHLLILLSKQLQENPTMQKSLNQLIVEILEQHLTSVDLNYDEVNTASVQLALDKARVAREKDWHPSKPVCQFHIDTLQRKSLEVPNDSQLYKDLQNEIDVWRELLKRGPKLKVVG